MNFTFTDPEQSGLLTVRMWFGGQKWEHALRWVV